MTNFEQVNLIKHNIREWNKFRKSHPEIKIQLEDADLCGTDLRGADLRKADLKGAKLREANLIEANLSRSDLRGIDLINANLHGLDLRGADLSEVNLDKADLGKANLSWANLSETKLWTADLSCARLIGTNLHKANFDRAKVWGAKLRYADLSKASLSCADFRLADLQHANLQNASLVRTDLYGANLSGADLRKAYIAIADMREVNLRDANIDGASITGSHVYGMDSFDIHGEFLEQNDLVMTSFMEYDVSADNLKASQLIYMIYSDEKIRSLITSVTLKSVLVIGFFDGYRNTALRIIQRKLREYNLLPIVIDLDGPIMYDFTGMIKILAEISYFVIVDLTKSEMREREIQTITPDYQVPIIPIFQKGKNCFELFANFDDKLGCVLPAIIYKHTNELLDIFKSEIIDKAIRKYNEISIYKGRRVILHDAKDFLN